MFEITAEDLTLLNDKDARFLVSFLCEAEMRKQGLPTSAVTSGGNQDAPDGGVDVRVRLSGSLLSAAWVPRGETAFQVKAQEMPPAKITAEMRPDGMLRPIIQELAAVGGAYVIVSSQDSVTDSGLKARIKAMRNAVHDLPNSSALKLDFYDGSRLSTWLRDHPSLILWVRRRIGKPLVGWFNYRSWTDASAQGPGEYIIDDKLRIKTVSINKPEGESVLAGIGLVRNLLRRPTAAVRLVGLSGVGKTRFARALFDDKVGTDGLLSPSLVYYADVGEETANPTPLELASQLIAAREPAVIILDNCLQALHRNLAEACRISGSTVSILTIEYDITDHVPEGTEVFRLETSSPALIEKLIHCWFPNISATDAATIAKFSDGNAKVAIALGSTVGKNETIQGVRDDELVKRIIYQRHGPNESLLHAAEACSLVYSFDSQVSGTDSELGCLGALVGQSAETMYGHLADLLERGVAQKRGDWRAILPHAIANRLAASALRRIPPSAIETQLVNGAPERLLKSFSRRLGYLDSSIEAQDLIRRWLGVGGLLGNAVEHNRLQREMFQNVAPVAPGAALAVLERSVTGLDNPDLLIRFQEYVPVIRSIAYDAELFTRSAKLLVKIAAVGGLERNNPALRAFASLFYARFSGTHAPIDRRLYLISALLLSDDSKERIIGIKALEAALEAWQFERFADFEFGARSRNYGYWPHTEEQLKEWFGSTIDLAVLTICSEVPIASQVKSLLARQLRGIWNGARRYEEIENACRRISETQFWPEGWLAVRQIQYHDVIGVSSAITARLTSVEVLLRPKNLVQEVRSIVFSNDYSGIYVGEGQREIADMARGLGESVATDEAAFNELLPELIKRGAHAWLFGRGLALGSAEPQKTWDRLIEQFTASAESVGDVSVLCGFMQALNQIRPETANSLLDSTLEHKWAVLWLPSFQSAVGVDEAGLARLMRSLSLKVIPADRYRSLQSGGATDKISAKELSDLLTALATLSEGVEIALGILDIRLDLEDRNKQEHSPEILETGRFLVKQVPLGKVSNPTLDFHLGRISKACFAGTDAVWDVYEISDRLKRAFVNYEAYSFYLNGFILGLFSAQPIAALDGFCGRDESEMERGLRLIGELRKNPLDAVPEAALFEWCDRDPRARYREVAGSISLWVGKNGLIDGWTNIALRLLDKAPDRIEVLKKYISHIELEWYESGGELTKKIELFGSLKAHEDPEVAAFVVRETVRVLNKAEERSRREREDERMRDQSFE